jgi:hypothetical protein
VFKRDSVAAVEARVFEWIQAHAAAPAGPAEAPVARVLELSGGLPLHLFLGGARLPVDALLLSWPLAELSGLELRPDPSVVAAQAAAPQEDE